jgi:hypothetical protein
MHLTGAYVEHSIAHNPHLFEINSQESFVGVRKHKKVMLIPVSHIKTRCDCSELILILTLNVKVAELHTARRLGVHPVCGDKRLFPLLHVADIFDMQVIAKAVPFAIGRESPSPDCLRWDISAMQFVPDKTEMVLYN